MNAQTEAIYLYTVYDSPKDFSGEFVVRRWEIVGGEPELGEIVARGKTLDEARSVLSVIAPGLYNTGRDTCDD